MADYPEGDMTEAQAAKLRAPFLPAQIGLLPKPTKKDNPKGNCKECGKYHGLPAVHLDYVGHAAVTDRLLSVDPDWSWRPMVVGPNGEPLSTDGGLWIWLTVAGVTRPGFGDTSTGTGSGGMKVAIGDAIRNAAMRFGVALDLWAKEDLTGEGQGADAVGATPPPPDAPNTNGPLTSPEPERPLRTPKQNRMFNALLGELNKFDNQDWKLRAKDYCVAEFGKESSTELTIDEMSTLIDEFVGQRDSLKAALEDAKREAEALPF